MLDEPFTGLDLTLRDQLIATLQTWQSETRTPILSVTHDIAEAFQLNAEVIKLSNGRITQHGPAAVVLAEERTPPARPTQCASHNKDSPLIAVQKTPLSVLGWRLLR